MTLKEQLTALTIEKDQEFRKIAKQFALTKLDEIDTLFVSQAKNYAANGETEMVFECVLPLHLRELSGQFLDKMTLKEGTLDTWRLKIYRHVVMDLLQTKYHDMKLEESKYDVQLVNVSWA